MKRTQYACRWMGCRHLGTFVVEWAIEFKDVKTMDDLVELERVWSWGRFCPEHAKQFESESESTRSK